MHKVGSVRNRCLVPAMTMPARSVAVSRRGLFWVAKVGCVLGQAAFMFTTSAETICGERTSKGELHAWFGEKAGTSLSLVAAEWYPGSDDVNSIRRSVTHAVSFEANDGCVCS